MPLKKEHHDFLDAAPGRTHVYGGLDDTMVVVLAALTNRTPAEVHATMVEVVEARDTKARALTAKHDAETAKLDAQRRAEAKKE